MKRPLRLLAALTLTGAAFVVLSRTTTTDRRAFPSDEGISNPLPPCPSSPNCVRLTRVFAVDADTLFAAARGALEALSPLSVAEDPAARSLDAVFRAGPFRDDVAVRVTREGNGSALHLRSASRVGYSDFGVNGRRVRRFLDALAQRLAHIQLRRQQEEDQGAEDVVAHGDERSGGNGRIDAEAVEQKRDGRPDEGRHHDHDDE